MLNIKRVNAASFVHKRGLSEVLCEENPLLMDGEVVYEKDTGRSKIGDGVTCWNDLPYTTSFSKSDEEVYETVREGLVEEMIHIDCGVIQ